MKAKKFTIFAYILVIAMLLPIGSMVATADNETAGVYVAPGYVTPYVPGLGEDNLEIFLDYVPERYLNIYVTDKRTGKVWETNPIFNDSTISANTEIMKVIQSQIVLYYSFDPNGSAAALEDVGYMTSSTREAKMHSHDDSVLKDQVQIEEIMENGKLVGYRVIYGMGETKPSLFPKFLTETQMEYWITQFPEEGIEATLKMLDNKYKFINVEEERERIEVQVARLKTAAERKARREEMEEELDDLIAEIPILLTENGYQLYPEAYSVLFRRNEMLTLWSKVNYTRENLEADYAESGYVDTTGILSFFVPVEYRLEGNSLKVSVITEEIVYPSEVAMLRLDVLPSFLGSGLDAEGYILVPDGSGALIELNKEDQRSTGYQIQVMSWSKDEALSQLNQQIRDIPYFEQSIMPVFGHKTQDGSVFVIIEQGADMANIIASVSDAQTKQNMSYVAFWPTPRDEIYYTSSESSGIQMFPKVARKETRLVIDKETRKFVEEIVTRRYCRLPETNFVIRYSFLETDKGEYYDMAAFYRNYLMETHGLIRISQETGVPFYADIYGVIDKKVSYVGFPFNVKYPLTTFDQAEEIVAALQENGLDEIKLRYMYMANGGAVQTYSNKFKVQRQLGGAKGFESFLDNMEGKNVQVYPNVDILHVFKDKMFDGFAPRQDAVETLGLTVSIIVDRNLATGVADYYREREHYHPRWAISTSIYEETFDGLKKGLARFDNKFLSLNTVGSTLNSNFDNSMIIDRSQSARTLAKELKELKDDGYGLIVDKGYYFALPYVSDVLNIPMTSSRFLVEDYEVPFLQMVLHGLVEYAGEPLNVTQDSTTSILKSIEYGAGVYGRYMYEQDSVFQNTYFDNFYSLHYKNWMEDTGEIYNIVNGAIGDVRNQFIVKHERLAQDVYRTTYEKGKQVVVNYSEEPYSENGLNVEPGGFVVVTGGAN